MQEIDKNKYEQHKESICDKNGIYMPKHTHAVIISMLELIILNQDTILNNMNKTKGKVIS